LAKGGNVEWKRKGLRWKGWGLEGGKCRLAKGREVELKRKGLRWKGVEVRGREECREAKGE
jgi:hypothetical protein